MRLRVAATVLLAGGLLLGSTGCSFFAPVATDIKYDASDGVSVTVGDIAVRNAFAVTTDGKTLNLVMSVLNTGDTQESVKFQYDFDDPDAGTISKVIAAGEQISFGNEGAPQIILTNADVQAGALMPVFVQYGSLTGKTLMVPVLDNSLPPYKDLGPTTLPTPTGVPTITDTATPEPTKTAGPSTDSSNG